MGTPQALPGGTPQALPGASLACDLTFAINKANCGVAINIKIPPIGTATTPADLIPGLHPADLQNRYGLPAQRAGGTVAIVDAYDDPTAALDLAVYRLAFGLSPCSPLNGCLRKVNDLGQAYSYPIVNLGWDEEISLDLDMVSAICPNCRILLVEARSPSFSDLGAAVQRAVSMGATAVSNSYYGPEWSGERAYDAYYHHSGVAMTVSAGDQDSTFYPAASPYVTAVGGTSLSGAAGAWSESAWTFTGRGCSRYEPRPSFQTGTPCRSRASVDLAAVADPQTGVAIFDATAGGWVVAGGTSIGAPIIAAAYELSANPQGPSYSYLHRTGFHDIAPAGYDLSTGVGSPSGILGL